MEADPGGRFLTGPAFFFGGARARLADASGDDSRDRARSDDATRRHAHASVNETGAPVSLSDARTSHAGASVNETGAPVSFRDGRASQGGASFDEIRPPLRPEGAGLSHADASLNDAHVHVSLGDARASQDCPRVSRSGGLVGQRAAFLWPVLPPLSFRYAPFAPTRVTVRSRGSLPCYVRPLRSL